MKSVFFINDTTVNKISYYHLLIFLMALPFDRIISELILISLCVHTLIHIRHFKRKQFSISGLFLILSIYILTIIGTVYTQFRDEAFFEWERQLAFLLFPLIFYFNDLDIAYYRNFFLEGLGFSCLAIIVCLYGHIFIVINENHLTISALFNKAFINHNFSAPIDMHATYFSMYIIMGLVGMFLGYSKSTSSSSKLFYAISCIILVLGIFQLSSKAMIIALAIIVNVAFPLLIVDRTKRIKFLIVSVGITLLSIVGFTQIVNLNSRLIEGLKDDVTQSSIQNDLLEPRVKRWAAAWELILERPFYGYGSGSEVEKLKEVYYQQHLYNSYLHDLNAHNEYLSMWLKFGIGGLILFLVILAVIGYSAFSHRDLGAMSFLLIVSSVSFSENILDANKGIFFCAFFFSLYYFSLFKTKKVIIQI